MVTYCVLKKRIRKMIELLQGTEPEIMNDPNPNFQGACYVHFNHRVIAWCPDCFEAFSVAVTIKALREPLIEVLSDIIR